MRQSSNGASQLLNSWKDIAAYLGRGVRTVQRWEQELRLPIHRIGSGKRSPVYTTIHELKFWMSTVEIGRKRQLSMAPAQHANVRRSPIEESRRLLASVHSLAQTLAENSVRQQRQAEILQANLVQMRSQMQARSR